MKPVKQNRNRPRIPRGVRKEAAQGAIAPSEGPDQRTPAVAPSKGLENAGRSCILRATDSGTGNIVAELAMEPMSVAGTCSPIVAAMLVGQSVAAVPGGKHSPSETTQTVCESLEAMQP